MRHELYLRQRLRTLRTLHDAVSAMRSLAAHHFRDARQTLPASRSYRNEIEAIISEIGVHQPLHASASGSMLVIASDLGLCGDYNTRLAQHAVAECRSRNLDVVYSVGRKARPTLARFGITPRRTYDAAASLDGLSRLLLTLAQDLMEDFAMARIGSLYVLSARFDGIGHFSPLCARLLPIEPVLAKAPYRRSPYVAPEHLAAVAVREYLYISLYEALLDSLASEHGMRLMAAEAALQWIDQTSAQTARKLSASRSESATQELLDIVGGANQRRRRQ